MKRAILAVLPILAFSLALAAVPALAAQTKLLAEGTFGPGTQILNFDAAVTPLSLSIKVLNGTERGVNRVSSATVDFNGKAIFREKDFNQKDVGSLVGNLAKEDILAVGNRLTVRVNGRPEAFLKVTILGEYPDPPPPTTTGPPAPPQAWYMDMDHDGYGAGEPVYFPVEAPPPPGFAPRGGDCDDTNPALYPGNGCP